MVGKQDYVRLSEGFSLKDVVKDGAHFTVASMDEAELTPAHAAFEGEARLSNFRTDTFEVDSDNYGSPFDRHRSVMEDIFKDGGVKKKLVRTGAGDVVPQNAFVTFHYSAYMEFGDEPFDSSVLQNKPCRVKLGSSGLLPGLEIGLLTMRKHEKADFLVKPYLAYGSTGCPPRIPGNQEILFDVELLDWTFTPDSEIVEAIDEAHLTDTDWERAKAQSAKLHFEGNEWFKSKKYPKALKAYRGAEKIVATARLKDEKEEKDRNHFLVKVYTNMAVCCNELKDYNRVCINCREAILLEPDHTKAHYYWGLALTALSDFGSARDHLMKAKKKSPKDKFINDALSRLEEKAKAALKEEKERCRRAFQIKEEPKPEVQNKKTSVTSQWGEQLTTFKESKQNRMILPGGLDKDELEGIRADVEALSLKISVTDSNVCVFKEN